MNFNKAVEYGLLAVAYVAKNSKDGLVKASSVSKEYGIPESFLSKVMLYLVKANVLNGTKGPRGGYVLTRPAKEISMLEIIEAVGGPLERTMEISRYTKHSPFVVKMERICKNALAVEKNIFHKAKLSEMIK